MSDNNEPAFPQFSQVFGGLELFGGMTLRDYFAGQALVGIMLASNSYDPVAVAGRAYVVADEMLEEREKDND